MKRTAFEREYAKTINQLLPGFVAALVSGVVSRNEELTDETWSWIMPLARKMAIETLKDQCEHN